MYDLQLHKTQQENEKKQVCTCQKQPNIFLGQENTPQGKGEEEDDNYTSRENMVQMKIVKLVWKPYLKTNSPCLGTRSEGCTELSSSWLCPGFMTN